MPSIASSSVLGLLGLLILTAVTVDPVSAETAQSLQIAQAVPSAAESAPYEFEKLPPAPIVTHWGQPIGGAAPPETVVIPPSAQEASDPFAFDTPTPPLYNRSRMGPTGTPLPAGALSGTGSGTSPASNPWPDGR
jgi:hypothetical protein